MQPHRRPSRLGYGLGLAAPRSPGAVSIPVLVKAPTPTPVCGASPSWCLQVMLIRLCGVPRRAENLGPRATLASRASRSTQAQIGWISPSFASLSYIITAANVAH
jgi:hypothetical protein